MRAIWSARFEEAWPRPDKHRVLSSIRRSCLLYFIFWHFLLCDTEIRRSRLLLNAQQEEDVDVRSYWGIPRWWHARDKAWFTWKACLHKDTAVRNIYLEIKQRPTERKRFPRTSGDSSGARETRCSASVLVPFIGPTERTRRNRGESVSERKCTRVKAPALPLYDPTRIYGPLPGVACMILRNISVGKPRKSSSLEIRSGEMYLTDAQFDLSPM